MTAREIIDNCFTAQNSNRWQGHLGDDVEFTNDGAAPEVNRDR